MGNNVAGMGQWVSYNERVRGDILLDVLDKVAVGACELLIDLPLAFLEAGYGASLSRIDYILSKENGTGIYYDEQAIWARRRCQQLICVLKKDGLIREAEGGVRRFALTKHGREKLAKLKSMRASRLPRHDYDTEKADTFTIVIFDVPEREKKKREWLRGVLKHLGFSFVQKSVWLGKIKIPKDFLQDIKELNLAGCIEIFQITKTGSLRHLL